MQRNDTRPAAGAYMTGLPAAYAHTAKPPRLRPMPYKKTRSSPAAVYTSPAAQRTARIFFRQTQSRPHCKPAVFLSHTAALSSFFKRGEHPHFTPRQSEQALIRTACFILTPMSATQICTVTPFLKRTCFLSANSINFLPISRSAARICAFRAPYKTHIAFNPQIL